MIMIMIIVIIIIFDLSLSLSLSILFIYLFIFYFFQVRPMLHELDPRRITDLTRHEIVVSRKNIQSFSGFPSPFLFFSLSINITNFGFSP